jgi:hypothetical protein
MWARAGTAGIYRTENDSWNAGHVTDAVWLGHGAVLVSCPASGVWLSTRSFSLALSEQWVYPQVQGLASGPDGVVFAGGDSLYQSDPEARAPWLNPWQEVPLGLPGGDTIGSINRIAVDRRYRRIFLATADGLFWSPIPESFAPGEYAWRRAVSDRGLDRQATSGFMWDVVVAFKGLVTCTLLPGDRTHDQYGILCGAVDEGGQLVMRRSSVAGTETDHRFDATALTVCASQPKILWAFATGDIRAPIRGGFYGMWRSDDGGLSFVEHPARFFDAAGAPSDPVGIGWNQNAYTGTVAVHPNNPNLVAIGITFPVLISTTFPELEFRPAELIAHADKHRLIFISEPHGDGELLLDCNDGGIWELRGDGYHDVVSSRNAHLPNLEFVGPGIWQGSTDGTLGVSHEVPGLIAAGLQDNAVVYGQHRAGSDSTPWTYMSGGDGGSAEFLSAVAPLAPFGSNGVLWANFTDRQEFADVTFDSAHHRWSVSNGADVLIGTGENAGSKLVGIVAAVTNPTVRRDGQLMYAVGAGGVNWTNVAVYGLFASDNGSDRHWDQIATLQDIDSVSSIAVSDGSLIAVAAPNGSVHLLDIEAADSPTVPPGLPPGPGVWRLLVSSDGADVIAARADLYGDSGGDVWRLSVVDGHWARIDLPRTNWFGLALAPDETLYVAGLDGVYQIADRGRGEVSDFSAGLPRKAQCTDLRFVEDSRGTFLYASTWGWSLWVNQLSGPRRFHPQGDWPWPPPWVLHPAEVDSPRKRDETAPAESYPVIRAKTNSRILGEQARKEQQ